MNKEEIKQWLRSQIDTSIKPQDEYNKNKYDLCYNKQYLRVLKLSKITGQPVNKNNFKGGEKLFTIDHISKRFCYYNKILVYLKENVSCDSFKRIKIVDEVFNEYKEYKYYKHR